jgi:protein-disulfide isomerase
MSITMSRILLVRAFSILLMATPTAMAETLDRSGVEKIIREYILENPEIIEEALIELENRSRRAQEEARAETIRAEQDALLRNDADLILGNPDGDVTLVEFFDFNCGYCKRAFPDLQALKAEDSQLRIVLKDFPILGPGSVEAAKVALAVKRLGDDESARDLHARLMGMQGQANAGRALSLVEEMGLDRARVEAEMASPEIEAIISSNLALAQRLGLTGTPSFVVGDRIIEGAVGKEPLAEAVRSVRE